MDPRSIGRHNHSGIDSVWNFCCSKYTEEYKAGTESGRTEYKCIGKQHIGWEHSRKQYGWSWHHCKRQCKGDYQWDEIRRSANGSFWQQSHLWKRSWLPDRRCSCCGRNQCSAFWIYSKSSAERKNESGLPGRNRAGDPAGCIRKGTYYQTVPADGGWCKWNRK